MDLWHFKWKVGVFGGTSCLKNVISLNLLHRFWWNLVERWRGPNFFTFKGPAFGTPKQKKILQFFVKISAKTPPSWVPWKFSRDGGYLVFFSIKNCPYLDSLHNLYRKSRDHFIYRNCKGDYCLCEINEENRLKWNVVHHMTATCIIGATAKKKKKWKQQLVGGSKRGNISWGIQLC